MTGAKNRSIRTCGAPGILAINTNRSTPQLSLSNAVCAMKAKALAISTEAGTGACTHMQTLGNK